jgi:hypothetical protein
MAFPVIAILTKVAEVVLQAKGPSSKARAGAGAGAILTGTGPTLEALAPLWEAFASGFVAGGVPTMEQLGSAAASIVFGYGVGWLLTWIAKPNEPKKA